MVTVEVVRVQHVALDDDRATTMSAVATTGLPDASFSAATI